MNATASTAAWALHDLGLATSLGGTLYGRLALHPAVGDISDPRERGEVVHHAWRRFHRLNIVSHLVFASTWLVGRNLMSGRGVDRTSQALVLVKDILVSTAVASGVIATIAGEVGIRRPKTGEPAAMTPAGNVAAEEGEQPRRAERVTSIAGMVNMIALAGVVSITALLAMRAGKSGRFTLLSRLLP